MPADTFLQRPMRTVWRICSCLNNNLSNDTLVMSLCVHVIEWVSKCARLLLFGGMSLDQWPLMIQLDVPLQHYRAWGALETRETAELAAQSQHTTNTQSECRHMLTTTRCHRMRLRPVKVTGQHHTGLWSHWTLCVPFPTHLGHRLKDMTNGLISHYIICTVITVFINSVDFCRFLQISISSNALQRVSYSIFSFLAWA